MLNFTMATYGVHLATGHSIKAINIKAGTMKEYMLAAAGLIKLFDKIPRGSRKELHTDRLCNTVSKVLGEVKRFEDIPNRCEAYTPSMQRHLVKMAKNMPKDSLEVALVDWFAVGLQGGNRRAEWCQDKGCGKLNKFQLSQKGTPYAFTMEDITFYRKGKLGLTLEAAIKYPSSVEHVRVKYRWQKNGEHGQTKYQSRNHNRPHLCSVSSWIRICDRFIRLRGSTVTTEPLSIYYDAIRHNEVRNVVANEAADVMRFIAKEVYQVTNKTELSSFSCHSLRVGACCSLYAAGYPEHSIKKLLRWKSESWMDYVRDLIVMTFKHNKALNEVDELPCM